MKKSFILYTDTYENIKDLSLENKGALLDAIFQYVIEQKEIPMIPVVKMAFNFIKQQLDRDFKKFENVCKRNESNINKRWNKAKKAIPNDTKNTTGKPRIPDAVDNDNDNDIKQPKQNLKRFAGELGGHPWELMDALERGGLK